nr:hypothetical protein [Tanacetum cinerariifolium]
ILEKIIIDLEDEVVNLLEKEKLNLETIKSLKSKCFESSEKKKGSSNTANVGLSAVSVSNLNKNIKRYSRKDLLACNNSHLGEKRSDFVCNDVMNVYCDSRMNDLLDDNNFFIFDDVNVRISPVSKMPFRKKPRDSMHIVQICLWIIDSGCSKHMTGNRALLTSFVEKPMRVQSINGKRYVLVVIDDYSCDYEDVGKLKAKGDIGVFVGYSKEFAAFRFNNKRTLDEASKKDLEDLFQDFYDEYFDSSKIMKSSTTNVETSINEEVFHESIPINMIPIGDEASTSHNVFNERLEDAYFSASTSFHDPSNVHTFYQPYPHEKK